MAYLSGKDGTLYIGTEVCQIRNWDINIDVNVDSFASNCTNGWSDCAVGVRSATGSFEFVMTSTTTSVPLIEGDVAAVQFHIDDSGSNYWSGSIVINSNALATDIQTGNAVVITYNWMNSGAITRNGNLVASGS